MKLFRILRSFFLPRTFRLDRKTLAETLAYQDRLSRNKRDYSMIPPASAAQLLRSPDEC